MIRSFVYVVLVGACCSCCLCASAQKYPERSHIRSGNRAYNNGDYPASEREYTKALEKNPESAEALFNLGNAIYKQEDFDRAASLYGNYASSSVDKGVRSAGHYNRGNAFFGKRELESALEEYKNALRINPRDEQARFNLAYVKKLLEKDDDDQENDDQDNSGGGDDENDDSQGGGGDDDQPDGGSDQGEGDNNDGGQGDDRNDNDPSQNPSQGNMTREEAERMLEAIQMNEDKTRDKVDEAQKVRTQQRSQKNW